MQTRHEMLTRFAEALTKAIGEELEGAAHMDPHMDSATSSALHAVSHVIQHRIDHDFIVRAVLNEDTS